MIVLAVSDGQREGGGGMYGFVVDLLPGFVFSEGFPYTSAREAERAALKLYPDAIAVRDHLALV